MTSTFPPLAQAVAGALGAAAANIGAYPLDLATTRLQTARGSKRKRTRGELCISMSRKVATALMHLGINGLMAIFRETVRKDGATALFDGLESDTSATLISGYDLLSLLTMERNSR
jgi:adenine nucleotide transporter 17